MAYWFSSAQNIYLCLALFNAEFSWTLARKCLCLLVRRIAGTYPIGGLETAAMDQLNWTRLGDGAAHPSVHWCIQESIHPSAAGTMLLLLVASVAGGTRSESDSVDVSTLRQTRRMAKRALAQIWANATPHKCWKS